MKVHCDEGVAIHIGPEPCAGVRRGRGYRAAKEGQCRSSTPFRRRRRARHPRAPGRAGVVEDPGMCETRERGDLTTGLDGYLSSVRIGKVKSRSR